MRRYWILLLPLAILLSSCGQKKGGGHAEGPANFVAGKGLLLSRESLESMGVKMMEIEEREMISRRSVSAQVFRSADEKSSSNGDYRKGFAYATATLTVEPSKGFMMNPRVSIQTHGPDEKNQEGRLLRMDDFPPSATQPREVLVEIPDEKQSLSIGAHVLVTFTSDQSLPVLAIPHAALLKAAEGDFVYVQNGKYLYRTAVKEGASDEGGVEIADGLLVGDIIAVDGVESLWLTELHAVKGGGHCH